MPVTRSATRQTSTVANSRPIGKETSSEGAAASTKNLKKPAPARARARGKKAAEKPNIIDDKENTIVASAIIPILASAPAFLPAVLSFSLDDAKQHLIAADPRFEDLFSKLKCRPFEHLERVDPFRTLATSILGQQISWLAARSITHKFIRLFDPSLPEKPPPTGTTSSTDTFFPSAHQVASTDIATLRTAGLSGRKAEYVQDLASRFADGRLSNDKILEASDEVLYEMLIAVRGIGKWTVDMFAIFSLRRPDIMPVGDLGVQRGLVRWFLSLHSPKHSYSISPRKLPKPPTDTEDVETKNQDAGQDGDIAPPEIAAPVRATTPDAASFPPAPIPTTPVTPVKGRKRGSGNGSSNAGGVDDNEVPMPPPAFTPSINRTLNRVLPAKYHPPALPEGLSINELQNRLNRKDSKKAILTPKEMEELTEMWKPYRSLGVFYMWALAEGDKS